MDDIVAMLRAWKWEFAPIPVRELCERAADEIERLHAASTDAEQFRAQRELELVGKLDAAYAVLRKLAELDPSDYYPSPALTAIQTEADALLPEPPK